MTSLSSMSSHVYRIHQKGTRTDACSDAPSAWRTAWHGGPRRSAPGSREPRSGIGRAQSEGVKPSPVRAVPRPPAARPQHRRIPGAPRQSATPPHGPRVSNAATSTPMEPVAVRNAVATSPAHDGRLPQVHCEQAGRNQMLAKREPHPEQAEPDAPPRLGEQSALEHHGCHRSRRCGRRSTSAGRPRRRCRSPRASRGPTSSRSASSRRLNGTTGSAPTAAAIL